MKQIIELKQDVWAVYENNGEFSTSRVRFACIDELGWVKFLEPDSHGCFEIPDESSNFVYYIFNFLPSNWDTDAKSAWESKKSK